MKLYHIIKYNYRVLLIISALLGWSGLAQAQILTDSNLPIVVINTDGGVTIPDEPKVLATMKVIWHEDGSRNYLSDTLNSEYLNYNGRIGIERRGSSSQNLSKKPYGLTTFQDDNITNNNVSILGMPEENDWILNSLAYDQTGMRDYLAYHLSSDLGQYATRCVYCEVVINGDYKGLYMFTEKIKRDSHRVNIVEMDETCINEPEVTGGYITKADKTTGGDPVAFQMESYGGWGWWPLYTDFIHHYPKPDEIRPQQNNYIKGVFQSLANVAGQHNTSAATGIPSVIDIPTFVDFMIMAEYTSNVDVYSLSTFFHKDRNGKLRAGPIWDYNLAWGYDEYGSRSRYDVWQFSNGDNEGPKFFRDLFETDLFRCYLAKRWHEVTGLGQPLNYMRVSHLIDQTDEWITEGVGRDNERWHRMTSHNTYVNDMKSWLQMRINWLNQNIGSYEGCADVDLPNLVISKIHYNPAAQLWYPSKMLEFIEITNNSDEDVDLTGVYFRELGLTYQFPAGRYLAAHEALVLCSDDIAFREFYGVDAYDHFSRNLSDHDEDLVLCDAWGNIIDEVHYYDSEPWPIEADGTGFYLELIDLNLDNNRGENWTVGNDLTGLSEVTNASCSIFPNPANGFIRVLLDSSLLTQDGRGQMVDYRIYDITGRTLLSGQATGEEFEIDLSHLKNGFYLMEVGESRVKILVNHGK